MSDTGAHTRTATSIHCRTAGPQQPREKKKKLPKRHCRSPSPAPRVRTAGRKSDTAAVHPPRRGARGPHRGDHRPPGGRTARRRDNKSSCTPTSGARGSKNNRGRHAAGRTRTPQGSRPPACRAPTQPRDRNVRAQAGGGAATLTSTGAALHCRRAPRAWLSPVPGARAPAAAAPREWARQKSQAQLHRTPNPHTRSPTPLAATGRHPPQQRRAPGKAPVPPPPLRRSARPRGGR